MATLQAPDGRHYRTDDETVIRDLTLGHGYRRVSTDDTDTTPDITVPAASEPVGSEREVTA